MWAQVESRSETIRYFHPGWFASVMGTGIIAVATHHADKVVSGLEGLAVVLWILSVVMFLGLIVPWVLRWVRFTADAWADTAHPTRGPFYSTMPIALLVLAVDFAAIGSSAHERRPRHPPRTGSLDLRHRARLHLRRPDPLPLVHQVDPARAHQRRLVHPAGGQHRGAGISGAADLLLGLRARISVRRRRRLRLLRHRPDALPRALRTADRPPDQQRPAGGAPGPHALDRTRTDRRRRAWR